MNLKNLRPAWVSPSTRCADLQVSLTIGGETGPAVISWPRSQTFGKRENRVKVDLEKLYSGINLAETLSCLAGK